MARRTSMRQMRTFVSCTVMSTMTGKSAIVRYRIAGSNPCIPEWGSRGHFGTPLAPSVSEDGVNVITHLGKAHGNPEVPTEPVFNTSIEPADEQN
jgi:hypothetical protein